jgi:hypothetical protein
MSSNETKETVAEAATKLRSNYALGRSDPARHRHVFGDPRNGVSFPCQQPKGF